MRIREILFHNFRAFRGEKRISFVDPLTDAVRPITVIAGTNGTGKTTILDTIEALLAFTLDEYKPVELIKEAQQGESLICLTLELDPIELGQPEAQITSENDKPEILRIAVGQWELLPDDIRADQRHLSGHLLEPKLERSERRRNPRLFPGNILAVDLRNTVSFMSQNQVELRGGLIYFPHDRHLSVAKGASIEEPPQKREWIFRFSPSNQWKGSLEQLWVWQNYLDLEKSNQTHSNLKPFVESVENILGPGRRITVEEGRVWVTPSWETNDDAWSRVRLNQLPSGEQQCLLLFGELARRRRKGAVIALDEPEISLHPTLQRKSIHQLRQFAREWDAQLLLATHSLEILRTVHESERINLDQLEESAPIYEEA